MDAQWERYLLENDRSISPWSVGAQPGGLDLLHPRTTSFGAWSWMRVSISLASGGRKTLFHPGTGEKPTTDVQELQGCYAQINIA